MSVEKKRIDVSNVTFKDALPGLGILTVVGALGYLVVGGINHGVKDHDAELQRERAAAEVTLKSVGTVLDPSKPTVISIPAAKSSDKATLDKGAITYATDAWDKTVEDASPNTTFKMEVPDDFSQQSVPQIFGGRVIAGEAEKVAPAREWVIKHDVAPAEHTNFKVTVALNHDIPDASITTFYTPSNDLVLRMTESAPKPDSTLYFEVQDATGHAADQ